MGLSQSLPVTSYIKMIDIWMLFTMTVPFLEVILYTADELFKRPRATHEKRVDVIRVKSAKEQKMEEVLPTKTVNSMNSTLVKMTVRLLLPVGSLIFTIIFWVVGLIASYSPGAVEDHNMTDCLAIDLDGEKLI